jgi:hypothetical protein
MATAAITNRPRASLRLWLPSALVLVALCVALAACTRSEWQELAVSEGGFSVLMRGQAHYARQQVETPVGKTFAHLYSSDRPDAFFAVGYADYPLAHVVGTAPEEILSGVRDTWVKRMEGRLSLNSPTKLAGKYPGIEFAADGKMKGTDTFLQGRLYLVDQRLYQVIALGRKGEISQGVVNRYLSSFQLIPGSDTGMIHLAPRPAK